MAAHGQQAEHEKTNTDKLNLAARAEMGSAEKSWRRIHRHASPLPYHVSPGTRPAHGDFPLQTTAAEATGESAGQ